MAGRFDSKLPRFALKAAAAYAFFAALWIVASDFLVDLAVDGGTGTAAQLSKGLLFVGVTTLLLYFLLRQVERGQAVGAEAAALQREARRKFGPAAPLAVFAALAALIAVSGYHIYSRQRDIFRQHKEVELATVADLKVNGLVAWLAERRGDAETVRRDTLLGEAVYGWVKAGKPAGVQRQRILDRLGAFWLAYGYRSVLLVDGEGVPLLGAGETPDSVAVRERLLVRRAMRRNEVQISDLHFSDTRNGKAPGLDVVAPLASAGGEPVGAICFRVDPRQRLYPLLRAWPTPSDTAEALLVRQEGDEVVFLNERDKEPDAALKRRLSVGRQDLPAALATRGREGVVEGRDYHGDLVLAVVRAVPETPWFLVVKVDRKEVFAELNRLAWVAAGLTLVFVAVAGLIVHFWWRRQRDGFLLREYRLEAERRQLASRLEMLSRHANDGILLVDERRRILDFNQRAEEMYGYGRDALLAMTADDLRTAEARPSLEEDWRRAEEGEGGGMFDTFHQRKDGSAFPVEISLRRIESDGQTLHLGVVRDVTERLAAVDKLRLDAKVFEASGEGIMITDADLNIVTVNRTFTAITGYEEAEVIGTRPSVLRSERHEQAFFQNMWASIGETGHWVGEIWNRRKSGEVFPAWLAVSAVKDGEGRVTHYIGVFADISSRKEAEERIRHLSHYDALTDLPNQFLLMDHIDLAMAHARRLKCFVAVMVANLDRFRSVNERYGHSVGDRVLQEIATRLSGLLREGDTVARMGADNFAIVMPDLQDKRQARLVAGKVLETVAEPIHLDGHEIIMNARVGIALFPDDGDQAEALMKNADIALASAKAAGAHNYVFFTPEQSRELEDILAREDALRHAIERDELRLHYQPRLDLVSGEIVAVEALVRWQHPAQGLLAPGKFILLAEQSGLILPIGEWVLKEACRQAQEWHRSGFVNLRVAVNVSALQLRQRNLVETVKAVVQETGFNPAHLELEFTESFLMERVEETAGILRGLKDLGLRLSIDDFGTGYSSLSYLKLFPIDMLKIDQSFVRDVTFDASDAAIVQGMIALGHSLKLRMVAEGVETEAQMGYLRSIHCDEMQGFFYSRPLPSTDMYALLQSNKRLQDISHDPGAVRKLLVVDDEPNITTALNRLLRREGYQILIAHSGREALEILAVNGDVGVVLSDQRMPEMSGIELLSKVKVLHPGVVRMILSGYTELSTVTDAINQGEIYKFLTKPWEDDVLREVVREAFQRHELAKAEQRPAEAAKKQMER